MRAQSIFNLFNNSISSINDSLPHTAQPPSINLRGAVSAQKPLIIDSIKACEGGSGGNSDNDAFSLILFCFASFLLVVFLLQSAFSFPVVSLLQSTDTYRSH